MLTKSGRLASQQPRELARFITIIRGASSYLEVGARHGDTFYEVMINLPKGSKGTAIDMPNGPWGGNSKQALIDVCDELIGLGYDISLIFCDSSCVDVERHEAVLIDADHRYESVKRDFEKFRGSRITALHDIAGDGIKLRDMEVGVPRFWNEIKNNYEHEEIILPDDDRPMGIGVIWEN